MKYGKRVWPTETTSAVCLILWFFYFCLFSNSFALSALMESASLEFIPSCSSSMNFFIFILSSISSLIWHIPNLMNSCLTFLFHAFKAQMMSAGHLYSCSGEALSSRLCCLHVQDTRTQAVVHRVPLVWFCTEQVEGKDFWGHIISPWESCHLVIMIRSHLPLFPTKKVLSDTSLCLAKVGVSQKSAFVSHSGPALVTELGIFCGMLILSSLWVFFSHL